MLVFVLVQFLMMMMMILNLIKMVVVAKETQFEIVSMMELMVNYD